MFNLGLPLWLSGQRICLQCRRPGFKPWSGKIPHAAEQLSPSVLCTKRGHHNEKPTHCTGEGLPLATTRESPHKAKTQPSQKHTFVSLGFPGGSGGKESACIAGDPGLIPGSGRSPGEGNGNTLQYSCLENSTDRGAWWAIVCGVAKTRMQLSD